MKTIRENVTVIHRDNTCPHGNTGSCYLCHVQLEDFSKKFIESQTSLPLDIQAIINKDFFELLA